MRPHLHILLKKLKRAQQKLDENPLDAVANAEYKTTFKAILVYWGFSSPKGN